MGIASVIYKSPKIEGQPKGKAFVFPLATARVAIIFLLLGLLVGLLIGKSPVKIKTGGKATPLKSVDNAVFTTPISYIAYVEGTLVAKDKDKITLEKDGSKLIVSIGETAPALVQEGASASNVVKKTMADVQIGAYLKGAVSPTPEYVTGNENGQVIGSSFFVTEQQ